MATLPLALVACGPQKVTPRGGGTVDLGVGSVGSDMAGPGGAIVDMRGATPDLDKADLYGAPPDPCDNLPIGSDAPTVYVEFPANLVPDMGFKALCQSGAFCTAHCPSYYYATCCGPEPADGGVLLLSCVPNSCSGPNPGRRPAGLEPVAVAARCEVGQWLAGAAHLEAASVHAFRLLGRELAAHGAPRRLVDGARRALRDEARHARITSRLARAHGAVPPPVRVARARRRSLEELAVENATEGCVRETFAAMLAMWQARAAADPAIRDAMAALAPDEIPPRRAGLERRRLGAPPPRSRRPPPRRRSAPESGRRAHRRRQRSGAGAGARRGSPRR